MFIYSNLKNIPMDVLYKGFVMAFSDYQVKLDMPFSKFENMLIGRGFNPNISIGAFKDNELIGFIYNGLRLWNNKKTAYDTGTGVIKEYRHQGITSTMFSNLKDVLIKNNIEYYLLEVLKTNTIAFELYKNQVFKVIRSFDCFKLEKLSDIPPIKLSIENKSKITEEEWSELIKFWNIEPSWQNSIDSIKSTIDNFQFSLVKNNNEIIGYAIIDKFTGSIPQIAVHSEYRNQGIGKNLIANLINNTASNTISIINVDSGYTPLIKMLLSIGFTNYIGQYEMLLDLN
ncbi:MAG: GNAT family N-acetyltransferase [Clostridium sp.]|nr:GNAT family N-acetyltransferase [Clostridium sp.]